MFDIEESSIIEVDATPTYNRVSVAYKDRSGDSLAESIIAKPDVTIAQIQAYQDAIGDLSQAVVYRAEYTQVFEGTPSVSGAGQDARNSVNDAIKVTWKKPGERARQTYVRAPNANLFDDGSDTIQTTSQAFQDYINAAAAVMGTGWVAVAAEFVERQATSDNKPQPL